MMKKILGIFALLLAFVFAHNQSYAQCKDDDSCDKHSKASCCSKDAKAGLEIKVSGNCSMCKARIEKAALGVKGVKSAVWNKKTKMLKVELGEGATLDKVDQAVAAAGHDTDKHKATDEAYNKLEDCCKYRN